MILIDREQVPGIPLDVYFFYSCFIQHFKLEVLSGLAFTVTRSKSFMSGRRFLSPGLTTHRRSDLKLQRLSWQWNNSFLLQLEHLRSDNFSCLFHLPVPIVVAGRKTVKAGECSYMYLPKIFQLELVGLVIHTCLGRKMICGPTLSFYLV